MRLPVSTWLNMAWSKAEEGQVEKERIRVEKEKNRQEDNF